MDQVSGTPDNYAALLAEKNERICMCEAEIKAQALLIQKLKHQLAGHRQHRFGQKSEGLDQLGLQLVEDEEIAAAVSAPDALDAASTVDEKASGCEIAEILDAAHLLPRGHGGSDDPENGIILRADLHRLFDAGLLDLDSGGLTTISKVIIDQDYQRFHEETAQCGANLGLLTARAARPES